MITPVGNIIKTSLQGTVHTFSTKMDNQIDTAVFQTKEAMKSAMEYKGNLSMYLTEAQYDWVKSNYSNWHKDNRLLLIYKYSDKGYIETWVGIHELDTDAYHIMFKNGNIRNYSENPSGIGADVYNKLLKGESTYLRETWFVYPLFLSNGEYQVSSCETLNLGCEVN